MATKNPYRLLKLVSLLDCFVVAPMMYSYIMFNENLPEVAIPVGIVFFLFGAITFFFFVSEEKKWRKKQNTSPIETM